MGGGLKSLSLGFTIVELLIVIIVIAILATLVLTTYSNVQQKAANTQTVAAVGAYIKAVRLYVAEHDAYPPTSPACLGDSYPDNKCALIDPYPGSGIGNVSENAAFNAAIRPYFGNGDIPTPSAQAVVHSGGLRFVGAYWHVLNVYYWLAGDVPCGAPGGVQTSRSVSNGNTRCNFAFPGL